VTCLSGSGRFRQIQADSGRFRQIYSVFFFGHIIKVSELEYDFQASICFNS